MTPWYKVDDEHDGISDHKCPADTNSRPSELLAELHVVVISGRVISISSSLEDLHLHPAAADI